MLRKLVGVPGGEFLVCHLDDLLRLACLLARCHPGAVRRVNVRLCANVDAGAFGRIRRHSPRPNLFRPHARNVGGFAAVRLLQATTGGYSGSFFLRPVFGLHCSLAKRAVFVLPHLRSLRRLVLATDGVLALEIHHRRFAMRCALHLQVFYYFFL